MNHMDQQPRMMMDIPPPPNVMLPPLIPNQHLCPPPMDEHPSLSMHNVDSPPLGHDPMWTPDSNMPPPYSPDYGIHVRLLLSFINHLDMNTGMVRIRHMILMPTHQITTGDLHCHCILRECCRLGMVLRLCIIRDLSYPPLPHPYPKAEHVQ